MVLLCSLASRCRVKRRSFGFPSVLSVGRCEPTGGKALPSGGVPVRSFLLSIALLFTVSCSRPDFDPSVQVDSWLESIDPDAKVIEVWCKANVEESPGSGIWKDFDFKHQFSALEVLETSANRGLGWGDIMARMIEITQHGFAGWVAEQRQLTTSQTVLFKMNFRFEDLRCDGKPLRSPSIQIGRCPNDTHGCDEPPMPTDQPPLPPPAPGGGGDF
jgi:hypothetical protein